MLPPPQTAIPYIITDYKYIYIYISVDWEQIIYKAAFIEWSMGLGFN